MIELAQFVAVLASVSFAAIALYISVGEHPARMECGPELASFVFGPSYRRAARLQASLAILATLAGVGVWYESGGYAWLLGAALIFSVVPITLVVIMPTNKKLLDPVLDRTSPATYELLRKWGQLHGVRTILSLAAALLFLCSLIWSFDRPFGSQGPPIHLSNLPSARCSAPIGVTMNLSITIFCDSAPALARR